MLGHGQAISSGELCFGKHIQAVIIQEYLFDIFPFLDIRTSFRETYKCIRMYLKCSI